MTALTPNVRAALVAALASSDGAFVRHRDGWGGQGTTAPRFTYRQILILERAWLFELDDHALPTRATLTTKGRELAEALAADGARNAFQATA